MKAFITSVGKVMKLNTNDDRVELNFDQTKKALKIPLYQREYKWTNDKVETLLRDINKRDKFLGLIILDEKGEYYEIVDGQQRLTTCLLSLMAIYNSYAGFRKEQARVKPFIERNLSITIQNESVGDYIKADEEKGKYKLSILDEEDVYYQKEDFDRVYETITKFITELNELDNRKTFFKKLTESKLLVFINDTDDNIESIEQMFLDINEKSQTLDRENIFKGHCFELFTEEDYQDIKKIWIKLKTVSMKFSKLFGYKDTGQYLYLYLLKDGPIPESMTTKGKHYLEGKSIDETETLLKSMIAYGESLIDFRSKIHDDDYCFVDFSKDCEVHKNDHNDIWVMRMMSQHLLEFSNAWNPKLPFMHFAANREKYSDKLTHSDMRIIVCALYVYLNLFLLKSGKKSKTDMDRSVIEEVEKSDVDIAKVCELVLALRDKELESFDLPETNNFNTLVFIFSVIDFYLPQKKFIMNLYDKGEDYNLEHFIIPKRRTGTIDWVVDWTTSRSGKRKANIIKIEVNQEQAKKYRKRTTDYLIINQDLNGSMESYDVVEKIDAIKKWHDDRHLDLPKHLSIYIDYINSIDEYQTLKEFKERKETDSAIIQPVYTEFISKYFNSTTLEDMIKRAFVNTF